MLNARPPLTYLPAGWCSVLPPTGLALGNILGSHFYHALYGHYEFLACSGGVAIALGLLLFPPLYRRLDHTHPALHLHLVNAKEPPDGTVVF